MLLIVTGKPVDIRQTAFRYYLQKSVKAGSRGGLLLQQESTDISSRPRILGRRGTSNNTRPADISLAIRRELFNMMLVLLSLRSVFDYTPARG